MDEINKNRYNKEQRAKYGTADIIGPVKESGVAVNALMGKSRAENKIVADKIIKQNPQEAE